MSMLINHLIVGANDVTISTKFYCDFLGFRITSDDPGAKDGQVLEHDKSELLIIPFPEDRLPNPAHFAFEVNDLNEFENLLSKAEKMNLSPRSMPSGVNLEIMVKI
jgi:catechol 2,3-dioxygenase-like lactoylglutathione lyase family enzyme